jgi:hypothetical protein
MAQIDVDRRSSRQELADLRKLGDQYFADFFIEPYKIDWFETEVVRLDLDDDGKPEAILRINGDGLCGASTCQMLLVKWAVGKATPISHISDSQLAMLKNKTNGWHDLWGHYYTYKWDGHDYQPYCLANNVCDPDTR